MRLPQCLHYDPSVDAQHIGTAIRSLREHHSLSQRQACQRVEERTGTRIRPSTISRWETGQQLPKVDTLAVFLKGLDADFADFQAALEAAGADPATSLLAELRDLTQRLEIVTERLEDEAPGS